MANYTLLRSALVMGLAHSAAVWTLSSWERSWWLTYVRVRNEEHLRKMLLVGECGGELNHLAWGQCNILMWLPVWLSDHTVV
jgi:hypothetical protein